MGNCIETCNPSRRREEDHGDNRAAGEVAEEEGGIFEKLEDGGECGKKGVMRIKIVLTREELQWLMLQLSKNEGEKRLEEALEEIERARSQKLQVITEGGGRIIWKPSLDSIMEVPEVPAMIS